MIGKLMAGGGRRRIDVAFANETDGNVRTRAGNPTDAVDVYVTVAGYLASTGGAGLDFGLGPQCDHILAGAYRQAPATPQVLSSRRQSLAVYAPRLCGVAYSQTHNLNYLHFVEPL
jgi:hypothetical protein